METKYYLYESKYNDYSEFWITTRMYEGKKLKPLHRREQYPNSKQLQMQLIILRRCITNLVCSTATAHARPSRN